MVVNLQQEHNIGATALSVDRITPPRWPDTEMVQQMIEVALRHVQESRCHWIQFQHSSNLQDKAPVSPVDHPPSTCYREAMSTVALNHGNDGDGLSEDLSYDNPPPPLSDASPNTFPVHTFKINYGKNEDVPL